MILISVFVGVFGCPTTVANVETVAVAPVCKLLFYVLCFHVGVQELEGTLLLKKKTIASFPDKRGDSVRNPIELAMHLT